MNRFAYRIDRLLSQGQGRQILYMAIVLTVLVAFFWSLSAMIGLPFTLAEIVRLILAPGDFIQDDNYLAYQVLVNVVGLVPGHLHRLRRRNVHHPGRHPSRPGGAGRVLHDEPHHPPADDHAGDPEAEEINALVAERTAAKKNKDFARADEIRNQLAARGITIVDGPNGAVWHR